MKPQPNKLINTCERHKNEKIDAASIEADGRKKIFDDIVKRWELKVSMSVLANIHYSLEIGHEFSKSTYVLDNELLHRSIFAFDNKSYYQISDTNEKAPPSSPSKKLKLVSFKTNGEQTWWNRAIIIYFKIHRQLGNNLVDLTSSVFGIKRSTV